jgi:hypothetical protein
VGPYDNSIFFLLGAWVETRTLGMLGKHSATELHPQLGNSLSLSLSLSLVFLCSPGWLRSHFVVETVIELATLCLNLLSAGITDVCCHAWLLFLNFIFHGLLQSPPHSLLSPHVKRILSSLLAEFIF